MTPSISPIARLSEDLAAQRNAIAQRWIDAVVADAQIEASNLLTHRQLLDRLPALLDELSRFLRGRDAARLTGNLQEEARAHGHDRWENGYAIEELLRELHLLRRIVLSSFVTRFAQANPDFDRADETIARNLLEEFFSSLISNSVRQFVGEQQEQIAGYAKRVETANRELAIGNGRLEEIAASRVQLTRSVAHELRGLLHSFRAALTGPRQECAGPSLLAAHHDIGHMQVLVDQLLEYSAILSRPGAASAKPFDPRPLFDELVDTFSPMARAKGLEFNQAFDVGLTTVSSDRQKAKQIGSCLLASALANTGSGSVLFSFDVVDGKSWAIAVSDPGATTAPTDQAGVLDESERGALAASGCGITLAIVKELAAQLGGVVSAISRAGTERRIEVVLPLQPQQ
jgi:hypothetical protein